MKASNLAVKALMRARRSSKLKSTRGSCVSGLLVVSEYEGGIGPLFWDARNEEVDVEKLVGGRGAAIAVAIVW